MTYTNAWIAIIVAAVAAFIIGWLWYGPLFGKIWMKLSGHSMGAMDESKKAQAMRGYAVSLIFSLITPYVFFSLAQSLLISSWSGAEMLAFWAWLGFQAPLAIGTVLWDGKPWGLFFLNAANQLVTLLVTAAIYIWLVA